MPILLAYQFKTLLFKVQPKAMLIIAYTLNVRHMGLTFPACSRSAHVLR